MIEISVFLLILLLTVILTYYNQRQARAFEAIRDMAEDLVSMQIRDRRAKYQADLEGLDIEAWLARQVELVAERKSEIASRQVIVDVQAVEVTLREGGKVLVTPTGEGDLKRHNRRMKGSRLATFAARSVLPRRYKVVARTLLDNEFLDIEAEAVAARLGLDWRKPARLWFYVAV
jgi:hypothetical protein